MRACLPASVVLALGVLVPASGQEKVRIFCDEADPANKCPGADCRCAPDTLEVTFDGRSGSVLHAGDLEPVATITATVVLDTKSDQFQGWAYGVAHDLSFWRCLEVTMDGTDAKIASPGGFDATTFEKIQECIGDDPRCAAARDGGGWISATVLNVGGYPELPVKRNSLAIAEYTLLERPGPQGTTIEFSNRLKRMGSPPVAINFTIEGKSRVPITLIDGFITSGTPARTDPSSAATPTATAAST